MTTERETQLELENARLREALQYYGDSKHVTQEEFSFDPRAEIYNIAEDIGEFAQEALSTPSHDPSPVLRLAAAGFAYYKAANDGSVAGMHDEESALQDIETFAEALTPEDQALLEGVK